jgi:hypothetical protein
MEIKVQIATVLTLQWALWGLALFCWVHGIDLSDLSDRNCAKSL